MTKISSHILDSTNGHDASGIRVKCNRVVGGKGPQEIFDGYANSEGRISFNVDTSMDSDDVYYDLLFLIGEYFVEKLPTDLYKSVVSESVVRLNLSTRKEQCHVPVLIAPNNFIAWWSA